MTTTETPSAAANTRSKIKELTKVLYERVGFEEEEIDYLFKNGLRSPSAIIQLYDNGRISTLEGESFPQGLMAILEKLALYLKWTNEDPSSEGLTNIKDNLTEESFEAFMPQPSIMTQPSSPNSPVHEPHYMATSTGTSPKITVRLSDYPKFTGKTVDWTKFSELFVATAELQGLSDLLIKEIEHQDKFDADPLYKEKCSTLFSILKHSCAGGLAMPNVKEFAKDKDGYKAWQKLYTTFNAKGNVQSYQTELLTKLVCLRLEPNTHGGPEGYISQYEDLIQQLEEAGEPLSKGQKTAFFLTGILDPKYDAYKTVCKSCQYDFEKCVLELRQQSTMNKKDYTQSQQIRKTHLSSNKSDDNYKDYWLPPHLWKSLTQEQRDTYRDAIKAIKNQEGHNKDEPKPHKTRHSNASTASTVESLPEDTQVQEQEETKPEESPGNIWRTVYPKVTGPRNTSTPSKPWHTNIFRTIKTGPSVINPTNQTTVAGQTPTIRKKLTFKQDLKALGEHNPYLQALGEHNPLPFKTVQEILTKDNEDLGEIQKPQITPPKKFQIIPKEKFSTILKTLQFKGSNK